MLKNERNCMDKNFKKLEILTKLKILLSKRVDLNKIVSDFEGV